MAEEHFHIYGVQITEKMHLSVKYLLCLPPQAKLFPRFLPSPTMGIIAGSRGNWVVNQESKMAEMLLKSC